MPSAEVVESEPSNFESSMLANKLLSATCDDLVKLGLALWWALADWEANSCSCSICERYSQIYVGVNMVLGAECWVLGIIWGDGEGGSF